MSDFAPDAERIDGIPGSRPRRKPRHSFIWIRIDGGWQRGAIFDWVAGDGGELLAWLQYDPPSGAPWPELGLFRYDSPSMRMRQTGQRPPDQWRDTITPEEAAPFLRPPKGGGRRPRANLPPCPGCGCVVERAFGDRTNLHVLPCEQRITIR